jgi:twitching motility protein PilT
MPSIDGMFQKMVAAGASDLHLTIGNAPLIRERGSLKPLAELVLTKELLEGLIYETMNDEQWALASSRHDYDYAYEVPGLSRFRGNIFYNQQGIGAVYRTIPTTIKTVQELGLPPAIAELAKTRKGLILVTGPTGSGKSTSLASIINLINETREANILTIEDPIEFVHPSKRCKITQREVHKDTHSFKNALRSSMRQDPDVILVGEMRDYETISLALTAAEMGILVFGTLHTNSASKTIDRIINVYPADERDSARGLTALPHQGWHGPLRRRRDPDLRHQPAQPDPHGQGQQPGQPDRDLGRGRHAEHGSVPDEVLHRRKDHGAHGLPEVPGQEEVLRIGEERRSHGLGPSF